MAIKKRLPNYGVVHIKKYVKTNSSPRRMSRQNPNLPILGWDPFSRDTFFYKKKHFKLCLVVICLAIQIFINIFFASDSNFVYSRDE